MCIGRPISKVLATETIAERAKSYSAWGKCVNGNDPDIVSEAVEEAVRHIRSNQGPAILEAVCNRIRGHYEGDTDHYRSKTEKQNILKGDPINTYSEKLLSLKVVNENEIQNIVQTSKQKMFGLLKRVRSEKMPLPETALDYIFCEKTDD